MNEMQTKAVMSDSKRLLVLAGAGTGKTTTMLSRISRIVSLGTDPDDILVLTFTNAAACDMKHRYISSYDTVAAPQFCTFHSFCYHLLGFDKDVLHALGYTKLPSVASEADISRIKTTCIQQCKIKLSMAKLEGKIPVTPKERFQFDLFWKQYNTMLRKSNLITFDIMCYEVGDLFVKHNPVVQKYIEQYKYIFVDEFQDTDHKQWDFVSSFTDSSIFIVGDVKQELYAFRNADSEIIKGLSNNPEWETIKLSENYRSTKQICDFANVIHQSLYGDAPYNLMIHGQYDGDDVQKLKYFDPTNPLTIVDINSAVSKNKSIAILCRTNSEVQSIISALSKSGIACGVNSISADFKSIFLSAIDSEYAIDWLSGKLLKEEYISYIKMCSIDPKCKSYDRLKQMFGNRLGRFTTQIDSIMKIMESDSFSMQKLYSIFDDVFKVKAPKVTDSINSNDDIIEYMKKYFETAKPESDVYVGTIHSSKGLEYDIVYLVGVNGSSFKLNCEDNLNCYYVGVTRAKEKLYVYYG